MNIRRTDRALTTLDQMTAVLDRCLIARLGLACEDGPYVVPVNFAYTVRDGAITIYAHGAPQGRKIDAIAADPRCCVEVDHLIGMVDAGTGACGLSSYYESVIGWGAARVVTDADEAKQALRLLVARQAPELVDTVPTPPPDRVVVIAVDLHTVTGKACR